MPRHRITAPPEAWPQALRSEFDALALSPHQKTRLGAGLGYWVRHAPDPMDISAETFSDVVQGVPDRHHRARESAMRRVLSLLFPDKAAALQGGRRKRRAPNRDAREELAACIAFHLPRLPPDWQCRAAPLLVIDPDRLSDGLLVKAWRPATIEKRLEVAAHFFDGCRAVGRPPVLNAAGLRAHLQDMQRRRLSASTVSIELTALLGLARALHRDRDWRWLSKTHARFKKIAKASPSRNASRALPVDELRLFGLRMFEEAERLFDQARTGRAFLLAHTLARTALTIVLLAEAPMRIGSLAMIHLNEDLLASLVALQLDGTETKTGESEPRVFSRDAVRCLASYICRHRAAIAHPDEQHLFVGREGAAIGSGALSDRIGKLSETCLGRRVTPHAFRHAAANFIVATAPDEAALATAILRHRARGMTTAYTTHADQVVAGRRNAEATLSKAANLGANTRLFGRKSEAPHRKRPRPARPQA